MVIKNNGTTYWSNIASTKDHNVTENELVQQIKFLIENIYIQVGNRIFRQTIGIPMGTDCAPILANLFLFHYEYKFMKEKLKQNNQAAKNFSNTFRYIDDLLTLNNPTFDYTLSRKTKQKCFQKNCTEEQER